jgi:hypothetical protein
MSARILSQELARRMAIRDPRTHPMPGDVLRAVNRDGIQQDWRITHVSGRYNPATGDSGTNGVDMILADGTGLPHWSSFAGYQSRPWSEFTRGAVVAYHVGGRFTVKNVKRARPRRKTA